jgi:hypothetical protein
MKPPKIHKYLKTFPFFRSLGTTTPTYHLGEVWENHLGLQIYRVIIKQFARQLRKKTSPDELRNYVEILDKDGVLVINNFLTQKDFNDVEAEYDKAIENVELKPYKGTQNAKLFRTQLPVSENSEEFPQIKQLFLNNSLLNMIASSVIRREIKKKPTVSLDKYQFSKSDGIDNDIENILHADLHTPTVKMFFYLNEVNENNGAFVYAKGSHKLTFGRILHEYDLSVRQAKLKKGMPLSAEFLEKRGEEIRNIISPKFYERMKVTESQICVQPNTLVITNNMGFHRRGEFHNSVPRKSLLINYRNAEPLFY